MDYFKIIYRTGEEDYETKEILIDENQHKKIQKALAEGQDFIVIENKATIKRSSIASISLANDIVAEYQSQGAKIDGLLEPVKTLKLSGEVRKSSDRLQKLGDWVKQQNWFNK